MATLAISAIGAAIGSAIAPVGFTFLGMSAGAIGWTLGGLAASAMQGPTELPGVQGPRLSDLKAQSASYGNMLPLLYGRAAMAGNVIWSSDVIETATTTTVETGGKGGGGGATQQQTTYTYSVNAAVAICEGPIFGVRKIWANGKLIYNVADDATANTVLASSSAATVYTGSTTQTADPTMQAALGAANVPAYRGTAYVVFTGLQLGEFGNRMPNFEFEVLKAGTSALGTAAYFNGTGANDQYQPETDVSYAGESLYGEIWVNYVNSGNYLGLLSLHTGTLLFSIPSTDLGAFSLLSFSFGKSGIDSQNNVYGIGGGTSDARLYRVNRNGGYAYIDMDTRIGSKGLVIENNGQQIWGMESSSSVIYYIDNVDWGGGTCSQVAVPGALFQRFLRNPMGISGRIYGVTNNNKLGYITKSTRTATEITSTSGLVINPPPLIGSDGYIYSAESGTLKKYGSDGALVDSSVITGLSNVQLMDSLGYLWIRTTSGFSKVNTGTMEIIETTTASGYTSIISEYKPGVPVVYGTGENIYGRIGIIEPRARLTATAADLGDDVVADLCERAGLAAGEIDVSDLSGTDLDGYVIGQRGAVRRMIEPLMGCYFFDGVESDDTVKFVARGGASAVTVSDDDLGAHDGAIDVPVDLVQWERRHEMELPVEVNLVYFGRDNQYQVSQQRSRRLTTEAKQTVTLNVGVVLSDDHARQIVDTMMFSAWLEREGFEFSTGRKFAKYEPGDVITLDAAGVETLVRIKNKDDGANGVIRWKAAAEDASVYSQSSTGVAGQAANDAVALPVPTELVPLDIPLLRDIDDNFGFYLAAAGYADGWSGMQLYQSRNDGASYSALANALLLAATTMGRATTALGSLTAGRQDVFDEGNSVTVVLSAGTLETLTRAELFDAGNYAALGTESGWEILQFRDATLTDTDTYLLTGFLRGRLGTEGFMASHAIGDTFVLLTAELIRTITLGAADLNRELLYKPVSVGNTLAATPPQVFASAAVRKKPLAPVHVAGGRDADGNISLRWKRRSRYAAPLIDGADAPLGETTERYQVDILDGATVKRTLTVTENTTDYTAAQLAEDFGSPTPATVDVAVYQVSDEFGRGIAATATI